MRIQNSRSGQAFVEYILIAAMVIGTITGVLFPLFEKRLRGLEDKIDAGSSAVMSQKEMGIPISWFFGGSDGDFNSLDAKFAKAGGAGGNGSNRKGAKGAGDDDSAAKDAGAGGGPGGGVGGGATGSNFSSSSPTAPRKRAGAKEGDDAETPADVDLRKRNSSSGGGNAGASGSITEASPEAKTAADAEAKAPVGTSEELIRRRLQEQSRIDEAERRGCQSFNIFTILKIIAVIVLLLIGGAVALSTKGNKEGG